jgi:hypothetical protein
MYTLNLKNKKSFIIIKTIITNGKKLPFLFIIILGEKIINNWLLNNLIGSKKIICSNLGYFNNKIVFEYIDHFIKYIKINFVIK